MKPCPFCGNDSVTPISQQSNCKVFCRICRASGPVVSVDGTQHTEATSCDRLERKAIVAWNNRTNYGGHHG